MCNMCERDREIEKQIVREKMHSLSIYVKHVFLNIRDKHRPTERDNQTDRQRQRERQRER